ncbi:MAG: dihydropteroate synthase [Rhodobacter sp.]|nr:dihydropteroate synthase [Rhodobacter sp.]
MKTYYRPIPMVDAARPADAVPLGGGWAWFDRVERLSRSGEARVIAAKDVPAGILARLTASRAPVAGLTFDRPRLMGILNVTPDSFSDGGAYLDPAAATAHADALILEGVDILDVGGESTRPGADTVGPEEEIGRVVPVISALAGKSLPISIDTRKAAVAGAALRAGATMLNDVSALTYDRRMARTAAEAGVPVCLMHAQGEPKTMHEDPSYDDVLFDVYDHLAVRVADAEAAGIRRDNILVDPGIGFGKTLDHNLRLLRNLSVFHGLGCPLLLGVSRKRFVGVLADETDPQARMPGSVAVAMAAVAQGVQILRVHDIEATKQALTLQGAVTGRGLW